MTPEKALDILEGRIPHREAPKGALKVKNDRDVVPIKENKERHFVMIFTIVLFVVGSAVFYLWQVSIVSEKSYKNGFNDGVKSINPDLTLAQKDINGKVEQINRLNKELSESRQSLELMIQQKEQLSQNLYKTQESASEKNSAMQRIFEDKMNRLTQESQKKINDLNNQLDIERGDISNKEGQLGSLQSSFAQTEQERNKALESVANEKQEILAAQKEIDDENRQINELRHSKERVNYAPIIVENNKPIDPNPKDSSGYIARGADYEAKGQYDKALSDFNKALQINPNNSFPFYRKGDIYYLKGDRDQAFLNWTKAIKLDSQNVSSKITYYSKYKFNKVIAENTQVIKVYPDFLFAYYKRGTAYAAKGDPAQAIIDFSKVIELNPKYIEAYNNRAIAYFMVHEYKKSWEDVQKIHELGGAVNGDFMNSLKIALGKKYQDN